MLNTKEANNVCWTEMRVGCGDILPFHLCHQDYHYSREAPRGGKEHKKYPEIKNKRTPVSGLNHYLIEISASYYLNKALLNSKVFIVNIVHLRLCVCVCVPTQQM